MGRVDVSIPGWPRGSRDKSTLSQMMSEDDEERVCARVDERVRDSLVRVDPQPHR